MTNNAGTSEIADQKKLLDEYVVLRRKNSSGLRGLHLSFLRATNPEKYLDRYRKKEIELEEKLNVIPGRAYF